MTCCVIGGQNSTQQSVSTTNHEVTVANAGNNTSEEELKKLKDSYIELEGKKNILQQNYSKLENENK